MLSNWKSPINELISLNKCQKDGQNGGFFDNILGDLLAQFFSLYVQQNPLDKIILAAFGIAP